MSVREEPTRSHLLGKPEGVSLASVKQPGLDPRLCLVGEGLVGGANLDPVRYGIYRENLFKDSRGRENPACKRKQIQ